MGCATTTVKISSIIFNILLAVSLIFLFQSLKKFQNFLDIFLKNFLFRITFSIFDLLTISHFKIICCYFWKQFIVFLLYFMWHWAWCHLTTKIIINKNIFQVQRYMKFTYILYNLSIPKWKLFFYLFVCD